MAQQIVESIGAVLNATITRGGPSITSALKASYVPNDLYAGNDWDALNIFEQLWARWFIYIGDPMLATGLSSFILHETFYFGRCIPWIIIDMIPYFKQWKIQDGKVPTKEEQWKCTKYVLMTHFTIELPQVWSFGPIATYFGMATHEVPFPSLFTMAYQIALFFIFEDFFHYWAHRALHWGPLYKNIHKLHHTFSAPFGLAAEYAHPLEIIILGTGTVGGPLLWCAWSKGNLHIITMYIWIVLRLFQAVDAHSGYDFPWSLQHIFPLWSGADHHDYHHEAFTGCYSTSFRVWDYVFNTEGGYRKKRAMQKQQRADAKKQKELKKQGFKTT